MLSLLGLLLIVSGTVLAVPPVYEALSFIDYNNNPIVPMGLGVACIVAGLVFLIYRPRKRKKEFVEVG